MAQKVTDVLTQKKEREEVLQTLKQNPIVYARFLELTDGMQEDLIAFCMGNKGLKITWDPFFKAVFNPEIYGKRLSALLSAILKEKVTVKRALPNESNRLTAEGSLLIMDILVELESGGLANIEMQRLSQNSDKRCYPRKYIIRADLRNPSVLRVSG